MCKKFAAFVAFAFLMAFSGHSVADEAKVSLKDGKLSIKSEDGEFSMRIGGRIMLDHAYYFDDSASSGTGSLESGSEARRTRLFVSGNLYNQAWKYKFQYDFTASGSAGIRDAYIGWSSKPFTVAVGNLKHPFSLDSQTSSKYVTFMERNLASAFYSPFDRRIGVRGAFKGPGLTATAGLFGDSVEGTNEDDGASYAARVTYNLLHGSDDVLHLGAGGIYRDRNGARNFRLRQRFESHVTDDRIVNTGQVSDVESVSVYGAEAAYVRDRLALKGEYMLFNMGRTGMAGMASNPDLDFSGYYAEASWFLTDDSVTYKDGVFKAVKPSSIVGDGGVGAWQVAVRYSSLDLTDSIMRTTAAAMGANPAVVSQVGAVGGEVDNLTLGVNGYLTPTIRLSLNYVTVLDLKPRAGGNTEEPSAIQGRLQIEF